MLSEDNTGSLRKTLFSSTPGNVHDVPPLVVYPQPACRKLELTLSNCLQPIVILVGLVGSTQIDGSFAASPVMSPRTAPETKQDTAATDKPATVSTDKPGDKTGDKAKDKPAPVTPDAQTNRAGESTDEAAIVQNYNNFFTTYQLGPEDVISVAVFGQDRYSKNGIKVPPSGRITLALIPDGIFVNGKTVDQVVTTDWIRELLDSARNN